MPNRFNLKSQADLIALDVDNAVTNSLTSLSQGGGTQWYPALPKIKISTKWGDHFNRDSVTPSGFPTIWSETGQAIVACLPGETFAAHGIRVGVPASAGAETDLLSSQLSVELGIEGITSVIWKAKMRLLQTGDTEVFMGFHQGRISSTPVTTLNHIGIQFDKSTSDFWQVTNANGTTQTITNTTVTADTDIIDMEFIWTSSSIIFKLDGVTVNTSTTNIPIEAMNLYMIIEPEGNTDLDMFIDFVSLDLN